LGHRSRTAIKMKLNGTQKWNCHSPTLCIGVKLRDLNIA
jgi:hypothetical protein